MAVKMKNDAQADQVDPKTTDYKSTDIKDEKFTSNSQNEVSSPNAIVKTHTSGYVLCENPILGSMIMWFAGGRMRPGNFVQELHCHPRTSLQYFEITQGVSKAEKLGKATTDNKTTKSADDVKEQIPTSDVVPQNSSGQNGGKVKEQKESQNKPTDNHKKDEADKVSIPLPEIEKMCNKKSKKKIRPKNNSCSASKVVPDKCGAEKQQLNSKDTETKPNTASTPTGPVSLSPSASPKSSLISSSPALSTTSLSPFLSPTPSSPTVDTIPNPPSLLKPLIIIRGRPDDTTREDPDLNQPGIHHIPPRNEGGWEQWLPKMITVPDGQTLDAEDYIRQLNRVARRERMARKVLKLEKSLRECR